MAGSRNPPRKKDLDAGPSPKPAKVKELSKGEELHGKLAHSKEYDKLMRSVLENDKDTVDQGLLLADSINHGLRSFTPDSLFEQLVKDYRQAERLYGERLIRVLSGYEPGYVERNVRVPEFRRELKDRLEQGVSNLESRGLIDKEGSLTELGLTLASVTMVADELERMNRKGVLGERASTARSSAGEKAGYKPFRGERYADVALKATIKKALRRGHRSLSKDDLVAYEREDKQRASIIYAIDASGSMKGDKLAAAKRAGIALSFKATRKRDKVGIIVFGREVQREQAPCTDFLALVRTVVEARASTRTDIAATIDRAVQLFGNAREVKHLVLLTDGVQTVGEDPESRVLEAASRAAQSRVTISVVGLSLDGRGESLSRRVVEVGRGTLYLVKDYAGLDALLIEDYYAARR
ncbi:VWA domain-containing protein [Candidatus Woesearchaeota archaeon]|nr:VWA domain-containing protein [Candidatus Woesearchaeota archaeon]